MVIVVMMSMIGRMVINFWIRLVVMLLVSLCSVLLGLVL